MIGADALFLHLNPLQEALQIEGNYNFKNLLGKILAFFRTVSVSGNSGSISHHFYDSMNNPSLAGL